MNIAIRADASAAIGLGHPSAASSLVQAARAGRGGDAGGCEIDLDCAPLIEAAGVSSVRIAAGRVSGELIDVRDFLAAVPAAERIVVDHYALGERWHRVARGHSDAKLAAIDDIADRELAVDWLIDQPAPTRRSSSA